MVAMMQSIVLLLVGFVLLIKGADFFVEGSSSVARALRIPSMIVGLTIVAMRGMCIICTVDRTERYIKKRNTSFCSVCGAFVCSGNFRHGDRKNRWCDIVTSFYWIFGMDGTVSIKSACGIGRSRRSFR